MKVGAAELDTIGRLRPEQASAWPGRAYSRHDGCLAPDAAIRGTAGAWHRVPGGGFSEDAASLYLQPGDVMECEIERIGVLRNPVVAWADAHP